MAGDDGRGIGQEQRRKRLSATLRENLKRRKAQQRGRAAGPQPEDAQQPARPASDEASGPGRATTD